MKAKRVDFGHNKQTKLFNGLDVEIPRGQITTIIGPNGCGKSTLLGILTRAYKVQEGEVFLGDKNINQIKRKAFSQKVAVLHQHHPEELDLTIEKLVAHGRTPYEGLGQKADHKKEEIVNWALACTGLTDLRERSLNQLSGGQRQRAWLAMALCQKPDILFLDEPTTYLDIYYQIELLELVKELNEKYNMTIVMVLHDLNQALNYSHHIIVMKDGKILREGKPIEMIDCQLIKEVYGIDGTFHEADGKYYLLPY